MVPWSGWKQNSRNTEHKEGMAEEGMRSVLFRTLLQLNHRHKQQHREELNRLAQTQTREYNAH